MTIASRPEVRASLCADFSDERKLVQSFDKRVGTPTLIVGAGKVGQTVAARLRAVPGAGLRPIGFLDKEPLDAPDTALPVLGASWDLERVLETYDVGHVVIAFSTAPSAVIP